MAEEQNEAGPEMMVAALPSIVLGAVPPPGLSQWSNRLLLSVAPPPVHETLNLPYETRCKEGLLPQRCSGHNSMSPGPNNCPITFLSELMSAEPEEPGTIIE